MDNFTARLEHTRKYAKAFWQHEIIDRPYVYIIAPLEPHSYSYGAADSFHAIMSGDYRSILEPFENHVKKTFYAGEAVPSLQLTLGPDEYAGLLGAEIRAGIGTGTTWSVPCVTDWEDFAVSIDKSENSYFDRLKKCYAYMKDYAADRFLIVAPDMHSHMDALSGLRGPQDLCMDLYDCPEELMRVVTEVRKTFPEIWEMIYHTSGMDKVGTYGWVPAYCDGKMIVVQCDFSALIGPDMCRKFVIPAVREEVEMLDHSIYHLDGEGEIPHLDDLLAIEKLDCIQWVAPPTDRSMKTWLELYKRIQAAGKAVWVYATPEEIRAYHKELKPELVGYFVEAKSREEAEGLLEYLTKNT